MIGIIIAGFVGMVLGYALACLMFAASNNHEELK